MNYRKCKVCKARIYFTENGLDPWEDIKAHADWHDEVAHPGSASGSGLFFDFRTGLLKSTHLLSEPASS